MAAIQDFRHQDPRHYERIPIPRRSLDVDGEDRERMHFMNMDGENRQRSEAWKKRINGANPVEAKLFDFLLKNGFFHKEFHKTLLNCTVSEFSYVQHNQYHIIRIKKLSVEEVVTCAVNSEKYLPEKEMNSDLDLNSVRVDFLMRKAIVVKLDS